VREVRINEDTGTAMVIVPDYQLSLAIGKEGQNARLAARLTGWRIDIKSEAQVAEEARAAAAPTPVAAETAQETPADGASATAQPEADAEPDVASEREVSPAEPAAEPEELQAGE
jgi:transcription termination/antitermination protein NusA